MSFEIQSTDVDVEEIMRLIRKRIEEKRQGLYTDEEIREIAEHRLDAVLDAHEFNSDLIDDFRSSRWNFRFDPRTIYESSRGVVGRLLESTRGLLRPVQKLFWNPNPMIAALSRQSDLNAFYIQIFHNLVQEVTKLNLEVQNLKNRVLELQGRLEFQIRREKTLETMVLRDEPADAPPRPREEPRG
ncbi:MAG: hypothetical protein JXO72_06890 [Vicinamibacteria bacterium]|nr:hypothetical protein [Vicinamibacteria bacterium]